MTKKKARKTAGFLDIWMSFALEAIVNANANDIVGAGVGLVDGIWSTICVVDLLVVVAVERAEITCIEANLLVDVPCSAQPQRPTVAGEGGVLLVVVSQTVVSMLASTADGELLVDVPFDTSQYLVGAVRELLLNSVAARRPGVNS